jgi:uncharacterized membrane protein
VLKKDSIFILIALGISSLYALAGTIVSVIRYWQYDVFYFDFGIFDKAIWSVSRFTVPVIDHYILGEKIIFADHFSPSIFILAPFFWIFPYSETLLVLQACVVAASGFILFLIGRHVLKNSFYAITVMLCYFLFVGLQNAVITDFHEVTIATLFFMLTFLCLVKQKAKLYFLCFLLLLGFKESIFLLGVGVGIAMLFLQPSWRKIAYATILISLMWGLLSIKIIIPFFSGGRYLYVNQFSVNPITVFLSFINSPIKLHTLFYTFLSFGFLPVLSPAFWFLIFQDFFTRFYSSEMTAPWDLGFHYSALTSTIMAVSSIYSIHFLQKHIKNKFLTSFMVFVLLISGFLYRVTLHGPFALSYNPAFYTHTKDLAFLDNLIKKVPKNVSVMAQNNLAPHFTHQKVWLLLSSNEKNSVEYYTLKQPGYIVFDNRPGQNPNDHFGISDINVLLNSLQKDKNYKLFYQVGGSYIYKHS